MHRGTTKPRGFAGDYMILNAIYENVPKVGGVGGYLDRYFLKSDLARAVRSRLDCVQKFLVRETLDRVDLMSILDVASGPGREFTSVFASRTGGTSAVRLKVIALKCVDIDQEVLDHLRDRVDSDAKDAIDVSCHRYNALRMSSVKANLRQFGECDMIYSVGLCDYIPDRQMIAILSGCAVGQSERHRVRGVQGRDAVSPGGEPVAGRLALLPARGSGLPAAVRRSWLRRRRDRNVPRRHGGHHELRLPSAGPAAAADGRV